MIVYITEQGSGLYLKGRRLLLKKNGKLLHTIHANKLDHLILMGRINISPGTINYLLKNNIDTVFMSLHGEYRGRLAPVFSKNIELRMRQFKRSDDKDFSIRIAKECVRGKLENYRYILRRLYYESKIEEVEVAIHRIRSLLSKLEHVSNIDQVRGYEGSGSAEYFSVFKYLIKNEDFEFNGRTKRPPRDAVNAMLSFGYIMLLNVVNRYLYIVGLDPFLGNLHEIDYGRPSLALDLMEEFRPIIIDLLVSKLVNKRSFKKGDFKVIAEEGKGNNKAEYYVLMNKEGLKKFIHYFEQKLEERVIYYPTAQKLLYRQIIEKQVRLYAEAIKGGNYKAFIMY